MAVHLIHSLKFALNLAPWKAEFIKGLNLPLKLTGRKVCLT